MINDKLYLSDGTLFANGYNRVVHGGRGDYIELEKEHIVVDLIPKFSNNPTELIDAYYIWLLPENKTIYKVYFQLRTVKYADYKINKYYISPDMLKNFKEKGILF